MNTRLSIFILCILHLSSRICASSETNSIGNTANLKELHPLRTANSGRKREGRFLRGGSYSRGSYNRGGSSSSYNWSRNRSSNRSSSYNNGARRTGGFGRFLGGLAFAAVGLAVLGMLFGGAGAGLCTALCCGATGAAVGATAAASAAGGNRYNNNYYNAGEPHRGYMNNNYTGGNQNDFEQCIQQAQREVENSFAPMIQSNCQPYSGQYTTVFVDPESGVHHNASLCIFFTPDPQRRGFRISGQGSDIDGNTLIEDGFAKYDGTAWWIERNISGDVGLQVLSRGKFNFYQHTFEGTWLANTMLSGPYLSFNATMMQNQQSNSIQSNVAKVPVVAGVAVQDGFSNTTQYGKNGPVTVIGQAI